RAAFIAEVNTPQIIPALDIARDIVKSQAPGHNVLRYLMLRMRNEILKQQYSSDSCSALSGLHLKYGCIPFDTMPFCTSLPGHNRKWTPFVGQCGSRRKVESASQRYAAKDRDRIPA